MEKLKWLVALILIALMVGFYLYTTRLSAVPRGASNPQQTLPAPTIPQNAEASPGAQAVVFTSSAQCAPCAGRPPPHATGDFLSAFRIRTARASPPGSAS